MADYTFSCIEGHTEGMPVRMVIGGAPDLVGETLNDRRLDFTERFDWMRRSLALEPRGHGQMSVTMLYPPLSPNADFALLFWETTGNLPMCGHATIGSVTFAIESGLVKPRTPRTVVVDVPAGQVVARYTQVGQRVTSVRFTNVPSFLLHRDVELQHPLLAGLLDLLEGETGKRFDDLWRTWVARPEDVLIVISTSGNSPSVLKAAESARRIGCRVISLTGGTGGRLAPLSTLHLNDAAGKNSRRIQETHLFIIHSLVDLLDRFFLHDGAEG